MNRTGTTSFSGISRSALHWYDAMPLDAGLRSSAQRRNIIPLDKGSWSAVGRFGEAPWRLTEPPHSPSSILKSPSSSRQGRLSACRARLYRAVFGNLPPRQPQSVLSTMGCSVTLLARSAGVCAVAVALLFFAILPAPAAGNLPEGYPATRYESLWKRSPFTLSSITEEQGPTSAFSERYSLGGAYTVGTKDYAIVVNRSNPQERLTVSAEPNEQGLTLLSISYDNAAPMKTTAVIKLGEETGPISFDEALIKSTATAAANAAVPMPPPQAPRQPTYTPGAPGAPTRRIVRPRIIAPPPGTTSTPTRP